MALTGWLKKTSCQEMKSFTGHYRTVWSGQLRLQNHRFVEVAIKKIIGESVVSLLLYFACGDR